MSFVKLDPEALRSIKEFLKEKGIDDPVRIDIHSTGCCDPSLGLCVDRAKDTDLVHEVDGIKLIISPETRQTVCEVTITYVEEKDKKGLVLTSNKPLSEWEGFGITRIRLKDVPTLRDMHLRQYIDKV